MNQGIQGIQGFHTMGHEFLSNFFRLRPGYEIVVENPTTRKKHVCPTAEHAYQCSKFTDDALRDRIAACVYAGQAKKLARKLKEFKQPDWDRVSLDVMEAILRQKFLDPWLQEWLLMTRDELIKTNTWGDMFWGVCDGVGENHLGKLLMKIREELGELGGVGGERS